MSRSTMSSPTSSSPKGDDGASSKDDSHPPGAKNKCEGAGGSAKHHPKDEKAPSEAINKHEDEDDDEHDWHSADEEYPNGDEYSYGDDHDEYSISDYIQDEIERQLTEEIDAALQREIDAQLDRAMEECERELDRRLEEEIGRSLSQSLQIADGGFAGGDYHDGKEDDTDEDRHYYYCSNTHATTSKGRAGRATMVQGIASTENSIITSAGNAPKDSIAAAEEKGGADDADLHVRVPVDVINTGKLQSTKKNEGNSCAKKGRNQTEAVATSVVDVNRAIQSVIDNHKIR